MAHRDIRLPSGSVLMERYRVGTLLGRGGFGMTYLAWDRVLELKLAVKEYFPMGLAFRAPDGSVYCPPGEEETFEDGLERFLEEARTLARLDRIDGVVPVRDYFKANGTAYMVMNYVEGKTLKDYLEERGGMIDFEEAVDLLIPLMEALHRVHREGCLHRDVSPDNILVSPDGRCTLIDFGAARGSFRSTVSVSAVLKPGYAPEEQYRGGGDQGPWTDVYAMGATLYRCVAGFPPPDPMERLKGQRLPVPKGVPRGAFKSLEKALAVNREDRFQDMMSLIEALHPHLGAGMAVNMRAISAALLLGMFFALGAAVAVGSRLLSLGAPYLRQAAFFHQEEPRHKPPDERSAGTVDEAPLKKPAVSLPADGQGAPVKASEDPLAEARRMLNRGDFEGALRLSEEAQRGSRDKRGPLLVGIKAALGLGRTDIARSKLEALMALDPLYPGASELAEQLNLKRTN
ncbi:protein kinase family protein [Thermanaerovibrio velox DSM 12556]|uniref:Protein kinase family protein n=1 Tax=Thermanaerovibrio velox DSM 12556 TaxID=926567 RepID=H0UN37_9BACT|nr:serine/threonine-protein kinase [Thermanaerovibrio velox]EHM09316.1 protein kinase family protein [Thermanaerovibrio velox DSM 12556]